ncbi:H3 K56 histone acetylation protein KAT11 [Xylaria flabelliformis]|nr:H3 K56 histone acetylation protein KAT11 [Xylaria flabelliformis]
MSSAAQPDSQNQNSPLVKALAQALPKDFRCTAWHLSTTPAITEALCYPPALSASASGSGNATTETRPSKPFKTYCEKHFLAVSVTDPTEGKDILALALEVYIYTTTFSTTLFVAKADSTGYLHLQPSPRGFSLIRAVAVAFLNFLVEHRARPRKQLVVNLFARAQSQYIFPGSVENDKKHILDDRGLIKWWCRVLDPLLHRVRQDDLRSRSARDWSRVHGYLVIPGLDEYETRAFVPRTDNATRNWSLGHPLELISPYTRGAAGHENVPPRCLIPTYPDDPKARFVEELEEATSDKTKLLGGWKSPRTLEQFWEMMAFRQECSSGRMTGFIWLVFEPPIASTSLLNPHADAPSSSLTTASDPIPVSNSAPAGAAASSPLSSGILTREDIPSTPHDCLLKKVAPPGKSASLPRRKRRAKKILKGRIIPRQPRIKTHRVKYPDRVETPYYYWPEAGRGRVVLDENGYKRAVELLLHLEFKSPEHAVASTSRWTGEVNMGEDWALPVVGQKAMPGPPTPGAPLGAVNNLSGSIRRKRQSDDESRPKETASTTTNVLSSSLLRKKVKVDTEGGSASVESATETSSEPNVNVLGSVLVRKKPKPS